MHPKNTILFCCIGIILLCTCSSHAAPEISNIPELKLPNPPPLVSGSIVTVEGIFNSKLTGPPLRYDNFEDGALGTTLPDNLAGGGWYNNVSAGNITYSDSEVRYSGAQSIFQDYREYDGKTGIGVGPR